MNLWTLRRQTLLRFHGEAVATSAYIPDEILDGHLSGAYREIQRALALAPASYSADLVAGHTDYPAPPDLLDQQVRADGLRVIDTPGAGAYALTLRTADFIREHYRNRAASTAAQLTGPRVWGWSESAPQTIEIWWPPAATVAGGLLIDYVRDPGTLARVTDQAAVTATVTNGSATVTLSSAALVDSIAAGDELGIRAAADIAPTAWYRITAVDGATLTLAQPYAAATRSGALFVTSEVSLIERHRPGLCQLAPVYYALWQLHATENGEQAAEPWAQRWSAQEQRIGTQADNHPGQRIGRPVQFHRAPALARKVR